MKYLKHWPVRYWNSFSFVGLVFATLFFSASVTPSLLPRHFVVQGLLSGFALAIGYAVGIAGLALYDFLELPQPSKDRQRIAKWVTAVAVIAVFLLCLRNMAFWQNSIRQLMEMPALESAYPTRTALIALAFGAVLISLTRWIITAGAFVARTLNRFVPRRISLVLSTIIIGFTLMFLVNGVLARKLLDAADQFFLYADELIDEGVEQPVDPLVCGSPDSAIAWDSIGRRGKNFLVDGPTQANLSDFLGRECQTPIRVYVGMRSAETKKQQAELALEELKRVGGFDRSVLIVATPTGTGWLDPSAVNTVEYLHGGDTAIVSMQYSYLPSWMTIIVDPERSIVSARALFDEIYGYWTTLPKDSRPKLYLHGLSLGSLGSESCANLFTLFEDPIQGALWSGPPFPSAQWATIVESRDPKSPLWLPRIDDGAVVRFTAQRNALETGRPWSSMRWVYIQYASDPMVFFSENLWYHRPQWLIGDRGPDVSPSLRWYPLVTFLQIGFDLPMATSIPLGYGHNYSPSSYIDAWIAVTTPLDWTADDTRRLKAHFATPDP